MRSRILTTSALAVSGAFALVALGSTPASAATLPAEDALFIVNWSNEQLYVVDETTAEATPLSDPAATSTSGITAADYDAVTDSVYAVDWNGSGPCDLVTIDSETFAMSDIAPIELGGTGLTDCLGLAFDADGTAYLSADDASGFGLFTVDVTTGEATAVGSFTLPVEVSDGRVSALAFDSEGTLYGANYSSQLFTIDLSTAAVTHVGTFDDAAGDPYASGMVFDSNDVLWINSWNVGDPDLWSVEPADVAGSLTGYGDFMSEGSTVDTEAIFLVPGEPIEEPTEEEPEEPALPATGADASGAIAAALAATGLGIALALRARRRSA